MLKVIAGVMFLGECEPQATNGSWTRIEFQGRREKEILCKDFFPLPSNIRIVELLRPFFLKKFSVDQRDESPYIMFSFACA